MPANIGERNQARVPLKRVKPVPHPRIGRHVRFSAQPDVNAVNAVEQNRQKDRAPFDKWAKRNRLQLARHFVVPLRAYQSRAVRTKMFGEECSDWNDSGKRRELSKKIT